MMFHSVQFLVLVGLTFAAYWAVTGSKRGSVVALLGMQAIAVGILGGVVGVQPVEEGCV